MSKNKTKPTRSMRGFKILLAILLLVIAMLVLLLAFHMQSTDVTLIPTPAVQREYRLVQSLHMNDSRDIAFSPDGRHIAVLLNGTILIGDVTDEGIIFQQTLTTTEDIWLYNSNALPRHSRINRIAYSTDGSVLYAGAGTDLTMPTILRWDVASGTELPAWKLDEEVRMGNGYIPTIVVDFAVGDTTVDLVVTAGDSCSRTTYRLFQWDVETGLPVDTSDLHHALTDLQAAIAQHADVEMPVNDSFIDFLTNNPDGANNRIMGVDQRNGTYLYEVFEFNCTDKGFMIVVRDGAIQGLVPDFGTGITRMKHSTLSADGQLLAATAQTKAGTCDCDLSTIQNNPNATPIPVHEYTAFIWRDHHLQTIVTRQFPLGDVAFSPDNRYLFVTTIRYEMPMTSNFIYDVQVEMIDTITGATHHTFTTPINLFEHSAPQLSAAATNIDVSPDGHFLILHVGDLLFLWSLN